MKKVCCFAHQIYQNNQIFEENNEQLNRNDILAQYRLMRDIFTKNGVSFDTQDITPPEQADAVLYLEMPDKMPKKEDRNKSYLFACETELINPRNWITSLMARFKTVFTVMEYQNPNSEFIKVNFPQKMREKPTLIPFAQKKFCTMVAGAKLSLHHSELYSERIKWINWFTKNHPDQFEFYGTGWKRLLILGPIYLRVLNKIPHLLNLFRPSLQLYRGLAKDKYEVLNQYKFSICYENAKGVNGNLTEKIFDCFFANNVPVYFGAPDVYKYIPKNCFIDVNDFKNFEEIYNFMNQMSEEKYNEYLANADRFLKSPQFEQHSLRQFAEAMAFKIINDLKSN